MSALADLRRLVLLDSLYGHRETTTGELARLFDTTAKTIADLF